ncbi:MAG: FixH family protein [Pseudoxanthomonas sp.]
MNRYAAAFLVTALGASTGCASVPQGLDLSTRHASQHKVFVVELEPPATPAAINQLHSWRIKLSSADGLPLTGARISVDGGMPQHGHGFPTQPRVTRELSNGAYLLEGMKFSMPGWWNIKLAIDAEGAHDSVTFNTIVGKSPTVR